MMRIGLRLDGILQGDTLELNAHKIQLHTIKLAQMTKISSITTKHKLILQQQQQLQKTHKPMYLNQMMKAAQTKNL